jgi:ribosomal protein L11
MKKGFNPTPKQTPKIKNVTKALERKTKEFRNIMRNPLVVAAQLDRSATLELDTSEVEVIE